MLGKLIKYELKATSRWFLPIYALALLLAPVERFMVYNVKHLVQLPAPFDKIAAILLSIVSVAFVLALVAIGAASVLLIIYRFYKNLVTNEGYLMHTLPVTTSQLIWSKTFAALIWTLVSFVVIFLALCILGSGSPAWNSFWSSLPEALSQFLSRPGISGYAFRFVLEAILMVLVGSLSGIFMLYASIALGQLVTKHKLLGAFGAYFLLNTVCQTVSLFLLPVLFNIQGSLFPVLFNIQSSLFPATNSGNAADVFLNLLFPMVLLFTALLAAVYYFITLWVFKKRLNLE